MNRRRKKSSNNKTTITKNKITRCRSKMIPVFENETCVDFVKKEDKESNQICKNCIHCF